MQKILIFLCAFCLAQTLNAQTFSAVGDSITDDGQYNYFPLNVPVLTPPDLTAAHGLVRICLNIAHTYDSDLEVVLVRPSGATVRLFAGVGGGDDNFTNTCFTATSTVAIATDNAPFTGVYKAGLGNANDGSAADGTWQLRILDTYPQDKGKLHTWSITFDSSAALPLPISSDLPLVTINTANNAAIVDEPKTPAVMRIYTNQNGAINTPADTPEYEGNIGIEIRGNYSAVLPQKPYGFETLDAAQMDLDTSLLGMPKEHDWCFLAHYNDKVMLRNSLAYSLSRKMGHYAPRTKHCELFVNGEYQGVYLLSETIKRGKKRVNIAKMTDTTLSLPDVSGGYIIKNDLFNGGNGFQTTFAPLDAPSLTPALIYHYPKENNIVQAQKNYIADFVNQLETALYGNNFRDTAVGYRKYLDVRSFHDYFIMQELTRNNDGFKKSCYFHKDRNTINERLFAGPVWDFDWAWKNINECPPWSVTDGSGWSYKVNECGPDAPSVAWNVRLLQDTAYANELRCRWNELRQTVLHLDSLNAYIDEKTTFLNVAQARHHEYWGNMGSNTGSPEVAAQPATYAGHVAQFRAWIAQRIGWLDANIPGTCTVVSTENTVKNAGFKIHPNPTQTAFNLTLSQENTENLGKNAVLTLYNTLGQAVFSKTIESMTNAQNVVLPALPSGAYIVLIKGEKTVLQTKLQIFGE
jgi:subtilisin-like proprotein convertase family protein